MLVKEHCLWLRLNAVTMLFTNLVAVVSSTTIMEREQLVVRCLSTRKNSEWVNICKDAFMGLARKFPRYITDKNPLRSFDHLKDMLLQRKTIALPL